MENYFVKAKENDFYAFEQLILGYEKLYYNIAFRMANNAEDAKDIVQDSLIKIFRYLDKCNDFEMFKNWSCKIVTNTSIDFLRKKKRNFTTSLDAEIDGNENSYKYEIPSDEKTPEQELIQSEESKMVLECIENLSEQHKKIIVLRDLNGMSYEDIAKIEDITLGTVKSRLARGRTSLKNLLQEKMELFKTGSV